MTSTRGFTSRRSSTSRTAAMAAALAAVAALAGGCGSSSNASTSPFLVGAVQPMSGEYKAIGVDTVAGLKAEASILNAHGGINGRKVKVLTSDDGSQPEKAISAAQKLIQSNKLDMFEPDVIVGQTQLPLSKSILSINMCASPDCGDGAKYPLTFTVNPPGPVQVPPLLSYLKQRGDTRIAVLATNDAAGHTFAQEVSSDAKRAGVEIAKTEEFSPTATDVSAQEQALRGSGAQAVAVWASGTTIGVVMKGMQALGWKVPVVGTQSIFNGPVNSLVPAGVASQVRCTCYRVGTRTGAQLPTAMQPLAKQLAKFGSTQSMLIAAYAADSLALAAYGYTKAHSDDPKAAAEAIDRIGNAKPYPGGRFWAYRNTNFGFHGTVHSPADADLSHFFAAAKISPLVSGTHLGTPFEVTG